MYNHTKYYVRVLTECANVWCTPSHNAPVIARGKKAQTVPTAASTVHVTIMIQFITNSLRLISLPNSLRWKATGRMTQIVKQNADPIKAITRSKDGHNMAIDITASVMNIRTPHLTRPRESPDIPVRPSVLGISRGPRPQTCSNVVYMGRALRELASDLNK